MRRPDGFIEVTSILDGRKSVIRAECIQAVSDNAAVQTDFGVKPEHRSVVYSGMEIDVSETLEEITDMIYNAEL